MVPLLLALVLQAAEYARAESLLAAGDLRGALRAAGRLAAERPRDARAHLLLGRVHYARPVVGRYAALAAFRRAARLAPSDPEPLDWQVRVGFHLGSDEGEVIAREALLKILALAPDYKDSWARLHELYRNPDIWRRAERALAGHPENVVALERRAELAIALEEPRRADSLLARVLARRAPHLPAYLLRAQAHFQAGSESAGSAWYDSALVYADLDSTGALWGQVWMIASPEEADRHDATPPGERRRFFEWFWSRRDPNLLTRPNERIAEHFRRLAYARRHFRLLHPQSLYHRSALFRGLAAAGGRDFLADLVARTGDTARTRTISQLAGLDARGLLWVRQGPPDVRQAQVLDPLRPVVLHDVSPLDLESWLYRTPAGPVTIAFARGSAGMWRGQFGGDFIFYPVSGRQVAGARLLLQADRTTIPARLRVWVWGASFKSVEFGLTDLYFKSIPDTAAVVLWDEAGGEVARAVGPGVLSAAVPPGRYEFGLDVDSAGLLGRVRGDLTVPDYTAADLTLSSLLLVPGHALADRETTLRAVPADLAFPAGASFATYGEIYGLSADAAGLARYAVRYTFARVRSFPARLLSGAGRVVIEFTRERPASGVTTEQLVIEPGRLPPGRYRVTLAVTDLHRNVKSESAALELIIR